MEEEKKVDDSNGKDKVPATIQIIITLKGGEVYVDGTISPSPVITFGMLEDAKIKLIGTYNRMKLEERMKQKGGKKEIVKPDGSSFIKNLREFLGRK